MKAFTAIALTASSLVAQVQAHTYIFGVYKNGVDQGSFRGMRIPGYNGPSGKGGYNNSPVKDLNSIDMRCNILGDRQAGYTIQVAPGDNLSFDWKHETRVPTDEVIASSHHGPAMVYISPDPPANNSFVKLWHEGLYELGAEKFAPGKWATTSDIAKNGGLMNVRIPAGLKAGYYLIRAELIGLHEADASYAVNSKRGAQFYPNCVQIEVIGDGDVELPSGVSFPGAYSYSDPGVVYDVYCSTKTKTTAPCTTTYKIPGPTVWSGAWPETTAVEVGPISGATAAPQWSSWIINSIVTSASYAGTSSTILGSSTYRATWSTTYQTPAPTL